MTNIAERLEYLRTELRAERISWGELAELQSLRDHIDEGDTELLEAAGVPEHDEDTSEDPCTEHGFDVCPDCGNAGVKVGADGYENCTRFLTCWTD